MSDHLLERRGFYLGTVSKSLTDSDPDDLTNWYSGNPVLLKDLCQPYLASHASDLKRSAALFHAVLEAQDCEQLLAQPPYQSRLGERFESLGCMVNQGDNQEIETVLFDALEQGNCVAEDLWMKVSWLSFYERDVSVRFRFSFGIDYAEDVAADKRRQYYAALLTEAVFPESNVITRNTYLIETLKEALQTETINFVERIIYFNSPEGGAYLHHDRERGHAGVVYAQLTGSTFWLALPKQQLIKEITHFVADCENKSTWPNSINRTMREELNALTASPIDLSSELETFSNSPLICLINETEAFVQQLNTNGHGRILKPGDALLLPQESETSCCWHTVFTLGETSGQALSFAIRGN